MCWSGSSILNGHLKMEERTAWEAIDVYLRVGWENNEGALHGIQGLLSNISSSSCRLCGGMKFRILLSHLAQLEGSNRGVRYDYQNADDFDIHFPKFDYRLPCILGFLLVSVGLWDMKLGSQSWGMLALFAGIGSFFYGCTLLCQSLIE